MNNFSTNSIKAIQHLFEKRMSSICLAASIFLWFVLWIRVIYVDVTHDEAVTFLSVNEYSYTDIISGVWKSANNHVLSSVVIKFFTEIFGVSSYTLRLFSLICFLPFTFFFYRTLRALDFGNLSTVLGCLICWMNPYLLDYFSLARGYAPAITMMMMSIFYAVEFTKNRRGSALILFCIGAMLSVLCNFVLLQFALVMSALIVLFDMLKFGLRLRIISIVFFANVILFAMIYKPLQQIMSAGELYFGGHRGLYADTALSMAYTYLYGLFSWNYNGVLTVVLYSILLIMAIVLIIWHKIFRRINYSTRLLIVALLPLLLIFIKIQHELLGTLYHLARTTLFLQVIAILIGLVSLEIIRERFKVAATVIFTVWLSISISLVFLKLNFTSTLDNPGDTANKEAFEVLSPLALKFPEHELGADPIHEPPLRFYALAAGDQLVIRKYEFKDTLLISPVLCWTNDWLPFRNGSALQGVFLSEKGNTVGYRLP